MTMVQIRNVPDEIHRTLKSRAAEAGMSLSEYALAQLRKAAEVPTRQEVLHRIAARGARPGPLSPSATEIIRAHRDA